MRKLLRRKVKVDRLNIYNLDDKDTVSDYLLAKGYKLVDGSSTLYEKSSYFIEFLSITGNHIALDFWIDSGRGVIHSGIQSQFPQNLCSLDVKKSISEIKRYIISKSDTVEFHDSFILKESKYELVERAKIVFWGLLLGGLVALLLNFEAIIKLLR